MKTTIRTAVLGLAVLGAAAPALAQPYGGYGDGYGGGYGRDRDYGYGERGSRYRDRDYDDRRDDGYRRGGLEGGFDAAEYLRCNPDVRRAVRNGQMASAYEHWRVFGRRERRPLSC